MKETKTSKTSISKLSRAVIEIAWYFGPKGLDGQCCENLSMPEFLALDNISSVRDCPVQEIGLVLGFTKSGATRIVNRLEQKGYVRKIKSCDDARVCCVVITTSGKNVLRMADRRYSEALKRMLSRMPKRDSSKVKSALKAMAGALMV